MFKVAIFGAKSIALGVCLAVRKLYQDFEVIGFLVSSRTGNPDTLAGLPVYEVGNFPRKDICILIAVPEDAQEDIVKALEGRGFHNHICVDSRKESDLMEKYYTSMGLFQSIHRFDDCLCRQSGMAADLEVYIAKYYKDKSLNSRLSLPKWLKPIQVGAALTQERVADTLDSSGDNISDKNRNYSELTALYWIWKNRLAGEGKSGGNQKYYGLFHYRRMLDLRDRDLDRLAVGDIDVVLPYPTVHEPDIREHHARYISESDWHAVLQALREMAPEYYAVYDRVFLQEYLYNYNILMAKAEVLQDYCRWLFPILERVEELSIPKGNERRDRYIGYIGENLLTLYFMYHGRDLKIVHAGRLMFT